MWRGAGRATLGRRHGQRHGWRDMYTNAAVRAADCDWTRHRQATSRCPGNPGPQSLLQGSWLGIDRLRIRPLSIGKWFRRQSARRCASRCDRRPGGCCASQWRRTWLMNRGSQPAGSLSTMVCTGGCLQCPVGPSAIGVARPSGKPWSSDTFGLGDAKILVNSHAAGNRMACSSTA